MSDTEVERYEEGDEVEEDGPRQSIRRMPDDEIEKALNPEGVGPFFPSGMSAPEAGLAGATANMSDDEVARLHGERVESDELDDDEEIVTERS